MSEHTVMLKKCETSLKLKYDVSPLDDLTIPLFSLEFLTQSPEVDENVTPLSIVHPQARTISKDVK